MTSVNDLPQARGQATLPYAEEKFRGNVGLTFLDSDPAQFPCVHKRLKARRTC